MLGPFGKASQKLDLELTFSFPSDAPERPNAGRDGRSASVMREHFRLKSVSDKIYSETGRRVRSPLTIISAKTVSQSYTVAVRQTPTFTLPYSLAKTFVRPLDLVQMATLQRIIIHPQTLGSDFVPAAADQAWKP